MSDLKRYDRRFNPFDLNHPKGGDYRLLYNKFFEYHDDLFKKDDRIKELETLVRELRDDHFKEVHWSNTIIGNKYRKIFDDLETKDR